MKGISMPMEIVVALVLMAVVILVWLMLTGQIIPQGEQQALQGYMTSCCISYRIGGNCLSPKPDYMCSVGADLGGNMTISALAGRVNTDIDSRCCK